MYEWTKLIWYSSIVFCSFCRYSEVKHVCFTRQRSWLVSRVMKPLLRSGFRFWTQLRFQYKHWRHIATLQPYTISNYFSNQIMLSLQNPSMTSAQFYARTHVSLWAYKITDKWSLIFPDVCKFCPDKSLVKHSPCTMQRCGPHPLF